MSASSGVTRFARRGFARLAYQVHGPADAERTVILLHALLADRGSFSDLELGEEIAARVIVPDARGHGTSASLADQRRTMADAAADVITILDVENVAAADLVGHGLGGATALELARRYPARVRSLTLIEPDLPSVLDNDPRPAARTAREETRRVERDAADAAYKGLTDKALTTLLDYRWGPEWQTRLSRVQLAAIRRNAGSLAATLPSLDNYAMSKQDLSRLTLPVLLIQGLSPHPIYPLIVDRLAAWLPNARVETVPAAAEPAASLAGEPGERIAQLLHEFLAANAAES